MWKIQTILWNLSKRVNAFVKCAAFRVYRVIFPLGTTVEYYPIAARKSSQRFFGNMRFSREEAGRETYSQPTQRSSRQGVDTSYDCSIL